VGYTKKPSPAPGQDSRLQPHDLDGEKDVLSSLFRDRVALLKLRPVLFPEHLFSEQHKLIYEAALAVLADGRTVNIGSVRTKLYTTGMLERAGGVAYLTELTTTRPDPEDLIAAAQSLVALHKLRRLGEFGHRCAAGANGAADRVQGFGEEMLRELGGIVYSGRADESDLQHVGDQAGSVMEAVKDRHDRGSDVAGVATGFRTLDEMTGGIHDGDVWYVAARPGVGKTSAILGMASNIAAPFEEEQAIDVPEYGVAFFSLEMPREQLVSRLICMDARINFERWRSGHLREQDWSPAYRGYEKIRRSRLWIDETPQLSLDEAEAKLMALKSEWDREATFAGCPLCTRPLYYSDDVAHWYCPSCHPDPKSAGALLHKQLVQLTRARRIAVAFFDYFGLMKGNPGARSREEEMGGISRGLKTLAKRRKVGVVVAAQLNREVEKRNAKDKRPQLSDLRETGSVEQDGDLIMFLYRASYYRPEDEKVRGKAEWEIAKQRNGPTGRIHLRFEDTCSRFYEEDVSLPAGL
jgi:replicative DNA helicase